MNESAAERALLAAQEEEERLDTFVDAPPVVPALRRARGAARRRGTARRRARDARRHIRPDRRDAGVHARRRRDLTPDDAPVPTYTPNYSYASALFGGDAPEAAARQKLRRRSTPANTQP